MKKTLFISGLLTIFAGVLISCGTTKQVQTAADSYISDDDIVVSPNASKQASSDAAGKAAAPVVSNPNKKGGLSDLLSFGNKDDYIFYDQTTVFTKEISGLTEKKASVVIRYDNQMAGFGSYNSAAFYFLQFDKENRAVLARAAEAYFSDFENKRLQRKGRHTDRAYGKIQYMLNWGTISSSTPNNGTGEGYVGYEFVKGAPYFTIYNYEFENDYYAKAGDATTKHSNFVKYYFTKSQLRQLVNLLSEDNINAQLLANSGNFILNPSSADEY